MTNLSFPLDKSRFPHPEQARPDGLLAVGGELTPEYLVDAYAHGIFPWFDETSPILWWSPPLRPLLFPQDIHVPKRLWRELRRFSVSLDTNFTGVITACAHAKRPNQNGTWITKDMILAYCRLHECKLAHSIEVWDEKKLVGGLYGVSLGRAFFGESMFHLVSNASKAALVGLCALLLRLDFSFIDCQQMTPHMAKFGAVETKRAVFLRLLENAIAFPQPDWVRARNFFEDSSFHPRLFPPSPSANNSPKNSFFPSQKTSPKKIT